MNYKSDNTNYPDPKNFWEWLVLQWNNHWDKEYQDSKKLYERLHRHEKITKQDRIEFNKAVAKQGKQQKRKVG